ncbi:hypothetical protein C7M84_009973 [Penaeus vannamei]|uniref:Uncharacterized protein n=1 Tax=Penaeus vannamei TaxID=6689 RepID=A0A3R7MX63_PENVA|nr:hypothetical protein C7M84_009973 [Penaeus vannamei]
MRRWLVRGKEDAEKRRVSASTHPSERNRHFSLFISPPPLLKTLLSLLRASHSSLAFLFFLFSFASSLWLSPFARSSPPREFLATTDAEGNSVVGRVTSSAPTLTRARCCNCPEVAVPDAVVDQLVRAMRKVVLDILEDNATSSLLRCDEDEGEMGLAVADARVTTETPDGAAGRQGQDRRARLPLLLLHPLGPALVCPRAPPRARASPSSGDDHPRPSGVSSGCRGAPEPPSVASSPSSSSPSSLFSSPSSSTSSAASAPVSEVRKDPGRSEVLASTGHDEELMSVFRSEAEAGSSPAPSSLAPGDAKAAEPHFLRSPRRVEDNPAVAHSFPRFRDDGGALPPRRPSSPLARKSGHAPKGDELQVRLNAILRSSHREDDAAVRLALRPAPDPKFDEEADDSWSHCEEATPPKSSKQDSGKLSVRDAPLSDAVPKGGHPFTAPSLLSAHTKAPSMWLEPVEDSRKPSASIFSKTHRYSVFTISGTLADPFGTNARYSLRSLSTAHF